MIRNRGRAAARQPMVILRIPWHHFAEIYAYLSAGHTSESWLDIATRGECHVHPHARSLPNRNHPRSVCEQHRFRGVRSTDVNRASEIHAASKSFPTGDLTSFNLRSTLPGLPQLAEAYYADTCYTLAGAPVSVAERDSNRKARRSRIK